MKKKTGQDRTAKHVNEKLNSQDRTAKQSKAYEWETEQCRQDSKAKQSKAKYMNEKLNSEDRTGEQSKAQHMNEKLNSEDYRYSFNIILDNKNKNINNIIESAADYL